MFKLDLTKLKTETLMDIIQNVHEGAEITEEEISIVGGSKRTEFQVKVGNKPVGPAGFTKEKAILYAAQVSVFQCFIERVQ